jgi:7-cyano-7-deazaguanine synthase in queuosine biosynthesis/intein/homing endonuclease
VAQPKAIVLLSGGLDSATVLAIARSEGFECYALSVDYGQRHVVETRAAADLAATLGATEHREVRVDLSGFGGSALTDNKLDVPTTPTQGIPVTYVPARNTIMLALAMAWAETIGAEAIFVGVNAVDYSVSGDTKVWIRTDGRADLMRIEDVASLPDGAYETISVDPASLQLCWKPVRGRHKHRVGNKRCFRVRLERGQEIEITEDHSLFEITERGQITPVTGAEIRVGTPLVVPFDLSGFADAWSTDRTEIDLAVLNETSSCYRVRHSSVRADSGYLTNRLRKTRIPLCFPVSDQFLRIVGLWLAEGGKDPDSRSTTLSFSVGALDGARELLREFFGSFGIAVRKSPANDFDYHVHSSVACEMFRRLGLVATSKSGRKTIPDWFWTLSQRQRRVVMAGLWDGDGSQVWKGEAPIYQRSHEVIDALYHCFLLDGIFSTVKYAPHNQKRLAITRAADLAKFAELYPLWHSEKMSSIAVSSRRVGRDKTTGLWKCDGIWAAVANAGLAPGMKTRIYNEGGKYDSSVRAQRRAFSAVPALAPLVECRLAFLRVVLIEPIEREYMYDLSVADTENFVAAGVLAHNSGYPDCRPEFIAAFQALARLATKQAVEGRAVRIAAPLIDMSKADIIRRGVALGIDYAATVSCYNADEQGRACGRCDSCRLRREGFRAAGIPDPTRYA